MTPEAFTAGALAWLSAIGTVAKAAEPVVNSFGVLVVAVVAVVHRAQIKTNTEQLAQHDAAINTIALNSSPPVIEEKAMPCP